MSSSAAPWERAGPAVPPRGQSEQADRTYPRSVETPAPVGPLRWVKERTSLVGRVRAWMVVLPVDALMMALPALWNPGQWKASPVMALLGVVLLTGGARYRARLSLSLLDEGPTIVGRILIAAGLVAIVIVLRHGSENVHTFLRDAAIAIGLVLIGRMCTLQLIRWSRRRRWTRHRAVLIGGGSLAAELARIVENPVYGLEVVGFVDNANRAAAGARVPHLGAIRDLDQVVRDERADVLLVATHYFEEELAEVVRTPHAQLCDLLVVPRMHHFSTQAGLIDQIGSIPVMRIRSPSLRGPARVVKRGFDLWFAGLGLVVTLPILLTAALAVRIESGPVVIFRQPRVGRDGVVFDCLKLRSMRPTDSTESNTTWSVAGDSRIGPVGRFLRRTSIDELPQLWNILRGDMSVVGPRPERPHFVERFSVEYQRYAHRHRVRAGLTGLAQVSGLRGDTSIADRARYDNYYIENWTLWLDLKIVIRTFTEILFVRGR